ETTTLVKNVTETSNNQLKVVQQLDEDMGSIDISSQRNASIAGIANQIAIETKEIATSVVNKVESQNFEGKNDVRVRAKVLDDGYGGSEKRRVMNKIKSINNDK
ncbi:MAG: hypothetical protein U9Q30_10380, partial [Campylobacterota bacterium]|nr:hypothetical protein [Campylobacterota bacterium]